MLGAIKHGLANLLNFQGRDARQTFWFFVLFLYLITIALSTAVSMPMSIGAMRTGIEQGIAQASNPGGTVSDEAVQGAIVASMSGYMPVIVWVGFGTALFLLLGLAASFVRRLHDSNLSGYWALLPAALQAFGLTMIPKQLEKMDELLEASVSDDPAASMTMIEQTFTAGAMAGWAAMLVVIALGVRKSTDGPNRFGTEPVRF